MKLSLDENIPVRAKLRLEALGYDVDTVLDAGLGGKPDSDVCCVTQDADLNEDWYRDVIVERWRGGKKLVPENWPRAGGGAAE